VKKSTVANTERAVRIAWLESIPVRQNWPHTQFWQAQRDDSEESTIFSFSKLHQETSENFTVRVLV
jgi:predicted GNAT superfamily acetyltransferase